MFKKVLSVAMVIAMTCSFAIPAFADSYETEEAKPDGYIVLGADLTEGQKEIVYANFGIENTDGYNVSYCTNEEEHTAFDQYLDYSIIGDKAYSSIMLIPQEEGTGLSITTTNINYCTISMYQSALLSAGVEDVAVTISAPIPVSGTCALLGAINAYEIMTGEEIEDDVVDAAVEEMVTMGEIGDEIEDNDTAAEIMTVLKQEVAESKNDMDEDEFAEAIEKVCDEFEVSLSDETIDSLVSALSKLQENDALDADSLKEQASDLFESVSEVFESLGINGESRNGFFQNIINAISDFFSKIGEFFGNIGSDNDSDNTGSDNSETEDVEYMDSDEEELEEDVGLDEDDDNEENADEGSEEDVDEIEEEAYDEDNESNENSEENETEIFAEKIEEDNEKKFQPLLVIEEDDDISLSVISYCGKGVFYLSFENRTDEAVEMKADSIIINGIETENEWTSELEPNAEKKDMYILDLEDLEISGEEIEAVEMNMRVYSYDEEADEYDYYFNDAVVLKLTGGSVE